MGGQTGTQIRARRDVVAALASKAHEPIYSLLTETGEWLGRQADGTTEHLPRAQRHRVRGVVGQ